MTRRFFISLLAVLGLVSVQPRPVDADSTTFRVIVNPSNPTDSISKGKLAKLLLKKTTSWGNGNKVQPVDLKVGATRDAMSRAVHGKSGRAVKAWWNQQIFAGKGVPPPEVGSDAKVVAYVLANPGAIGYVSADAAIGDCKLVTLTD
jgi:ABC-type phosphate transport system substrate-binding protein